MKKQLLTPVIVIALVLINVCWALVAVAPNGGLWFWGKVVLLFVAFAVQLQMIKTIGLLESLND